MSVSIYYLDDEPGLCEVFDETVGEDPGYDAKTFTDAEPFLAAVQSDRPQVVVIDYRPKGTNGDEVAAKIPEGILKVLVTGENKLIAKASYDGILEKPYEPEEILALLGGILGRNRA